VLLALGQPEIVGCDELVVVVGGFVVVVVGGFVVVVVGGFVVVVVVGAVVVVALAVVVVLVGGGLWPPPPQPRQRAEFAAS
jgi:hypothetical protein